MIYNLPRKKRIQITNYLTFSSPNPFSISVATPGWDGKLYCSTDTKKWAEWTGNEVNATETDGTYALYFRGTGNTKIAGGFPNKWTLSGSSISCTGNIESLLDYETVEAEQNPTMADYCYSFMFSGCTSIKLAISKSHEYDKEYRIPKSGNGVTATSALNNMFKGTGGTFTGTPSINTTYYTSNTIV